MLSSITKKWKALHDTVSYGHVDVVKLSTKEDKRKINFKKKDFKLKKK